MADLPSISVSEETYARIRREAQARGKNVREFMDEVLAGPLTMPAKLREPRLNWPRLPIPPALYEKLEARGEANGTSAGHEARVILQAVMESTCS